MIEEPKPLTIKKNWKRPSKEQLKVFQNIPTGFVTDALDGAGTLSIDKLRKMFPHNGFEPWQDMWMMIWAWYLYIPVKVMHDVCYERVKYKSEKKNDRVKGRCKQTIGEYENRIMKQTEKWPKEMVYHASGYIQHRGNRHYLEWDLSLIHI